MNDKLELEITLLKQRIEDLENKVNTLSQINNLISQQELRNIQPQSFRKVNGAWVSTLDEKKEVGRDK